MKQLNAIYWFHALNVAAWSLINIFIPIYFLTLGRSPKEVFVFYAIYGVAILILCNLVGHLCGRIGLKKSLLISFVFLFAFIWMLYSMGKYPGIFFAGALIYAANVAFYCVPLHVFFIKNVKNERLGKDTGKLFAFEQTSNLVGPLIGGFVAAAGGFPLLIVCTGLASFASSFLLIFIENGVPEVKIGVAGFSRFLMRYPRYAIAEAANAFQYQFESIIWPIFIFLVFHNIFSIGIIGSLLAAGGIFLTLAIGRQSDRVNKRNIIAIGALIAALIWLIRLYVQSEILFYATSLAAGFFSTLIYVPLAAYAYSIAKKENAIEFIMFREFPIFIGRLLAFGLAILVVDNLNWTFIPAAISNVLFLLL